MESIMDVDQPEEAVRQDRQDEALYDFSYDDDGGDDVRPSGGQVDDESNMSALDLYTDMVIRDGEEAALSMAKLKEEKESFKGQLDAALLKVTTLSKENETLTKENQVLKSNISVLLKTAKMELQRKERELNELREMQLGGTRPAGNALSPRKRKTRRAPKHHQKPALLRQNGVQHPKNAREGNAAKYIDRRTRDSDSDQEQKPDVRETMFVRRQRAKDQQYSTGATSQSSRMPHLSSHERDLDGRKESVNEALMRLSQQSSLQTETLHPETKDKEKVKQLMKDADGSDIQGKSKPLSEDVLRHSEPKDLRTQKPEDVEASVQSLETLGGKTEEKYLRKRSRSRSVERAIRSTSREKSDRKRSDDRSKHNQQKVHTRSRSPEISSKSYSDAKRSSPKRSSRSRSNDKRSPRSKSRDRKSVQGRSSRSKSHERSSRSKSRDRALQGKSYDKSQSSNQRKEGIPRRDSSSATRSELDHKRSKSARDTLFKQAESLAFRRSRTAGRTIGEKHSSKERLRERDSRRSSTPIRDSIRKDSLNAKEDRKMLSSIKMASDSDKDRRLLERGQSQARERMSSMAKESVAKAKARLNKCTKGSSSPTKSHRLEKERRRSSKDLCLDGLTDWTKAEGRIKTTSTGEGRTDVKDLTSRRKHERRHESKERKRKHRLSSSFQKESRLSKKRRDGSGSDDNQKVNIPEEYLHEESGINPVTYEEGHTVLACGKKDSIECTSSKVTVLHISTSDAYDTTQSEMSFTYLSGFQSDHGGQKQPPNDAEAALSKEIREEGELSEGEIVSDEEETTREDVAMHGSSEKKQKQSSKHRHGDHHFERKQRNKETSKSASRGKKHKRQSSSDQELGETRKRLKENEKDDNSLLSQSAKENKACEDDIVGPLFTKNTFPPLSTANESEFQPKSSVSNLDKEKDTLVSDERLAGDHLTKNIDAEGVVMTQMSRSPMDNSADVENVAKTGTLKSPVEEVEDNRVSTLHDESGSESILKSEDAVESDTMCPRIETSPKKAIPSTLKESAFEVGLKTQDEAPEADANVSRGILFEDLCLSSSMDDTSYLSCNEANSENQKQSFTNSIEKVDNVIRDIQDPLVNLSAFDMGELGKPSEIGKLDTKTTADLETITLDPHHIPLKAVTSESMHVSSIHRQVPSELKMKDVISDVIVDDGNQQKIGQEKAINSSLADTSVELNTGESSELPQGGAVNSRVEDVLAVNADKSEFAIHDSDEDNDAVSLLAASGDLDSFMQDIPPKTKRVFELSLNESKSILKEAEAFDKTDSSLQLTCEWSNIEFQDSSTKMGAEPDPGTVTIAAPVLDDGCAQDMKYAKDPLGLDTSVLNGEEHEEQNETARKDKEKKNIEERQTDMSKETSKDLTNEGHLVVIDKVREEELSPSGVTEYMYKKEDEQEMLDEGIVLQQSISREEGHDSCHHIVISDEDRIENELDFEEEEEEEEEESVYIIDVQHADAANKGVEQGNESHVDSEEEKEELNLSGNQAPDAESEQNSLKSLEDINDPSAVGENKGKEKTISGKGQSESEVESELDWESEPEDQNGIVGQKKFGVESEDSDELSNGTAGKVLDTEIKEDISEDREEGTNRGYREDEELDTKEDVKTDGDQENLEEDSEEEGEIVGDEEEEEHARHPDREHDRKEPCEKSRTDQRQKRDHSGHGHGHHHHHHHRSVHRDSSRGTRDRSSDSRRLDTKRKGERGRSGSSDKRLHRERHERDGRKPPNKEDRERSGRGHSDKESSRKANEQRHDASERRREEERRRDEERRRVEDRRREEDRKKAFLEKKREEDRRRVERRKAEEKREARRLEDERKRHEERKRGPRREEHEKVSSRLHDSEKKREPARKPKKVSEGRKS